MILIRYSKLKGGIATIYVGANSEVELKEKKDRVEDAVCATKAAIEEGIVPGGGSVYIKAVDQLNNLIYTNSDINTGVNIIRHALCYPIKQICSNAGISGNVIIDKIISRERQPIKHVVYIGNDQEGTYIPNPEMQNYGYYCRGYSNPGEGLTASETCDMITQTPLWWNR